MTENTGRAGVFTAIDSMVANPGRHIVHAQPNEGAKRVQVGDGEVQHTQLSPPTPGSTMRIPDDGVDITQAAAQLQASIQSLQDQLTATSGYDPVTGREMLVNPVGSRERANIERQLRQLKVSAAHQLNVWTKLQAQREADAAGTARKQEIERFVAGDPARRAALRAELIRREASDFADKLLGKK